MDLGCKPEHFDLKLVVVLDKTLNTHQLNDRTAQAPSPVYAFNKYLPHGSVRADRPLSLFGTARYLEDNNKSDVAFDLRQEHLQALSPDELFILRLLKHGRVSMHILINSIGGGTPSFDANLFTPIRAIRSRGGKVRSYVTDIAFSNAAHVFAASDQRFVLPETTVGFHVGSAQIIQRIPSPIASAPNRILQNISIVPLSPETIGSHVVYVRGMLRDLSTPGMRDKVLSDFNGEVRNPANTDSSIEFNGTEARDSFQSTWLCNDVDDLFQAFAVNFAADGNGWSPGGYILDWFKARTVWKTLKEDTDLFLPWTLE